MRLLHSKRGPPSEELRAHRYVAYGKYSVKVVMEGTLLVSNDDGLKCGRATAQIERFNQFFARPTRSAGGQRKHKVIA